MALATVLMLTTVSCRHTVPRRGSWWSVYLRGLELAMDEDWAGASTQFEMAIGRRPGARYARPGDARRAKTYGLHFLDDYFPHRELGVCLLKMGSPTAAEAELLRSLGDTPSSRAQHYLNRAREVQLERLREQGQRLDESPIIRVRRTPKGLWLRRPEVALSVNCTGAYRVTDMRVNSVPLLIEQADHELNLEHDLSLKPGAQRLTVTARDLAGNTAVWEEAVTVDMLAPVITARPSADGKRVTVKTTDDHGLAMVTVNGQTQTIPAGGKAITAGVPLPKGGAVTCRSLDLAGNESVLTLPASDLASVLREAPDVRLAGKPPKSLPRSEPDRDPPEIRLFPDVAERVTVTTSFYVLDLLARDPSGVRRLDFQRGNDSPQRYVPAEDAPFLRTAKTIALVPGENILRVTADDARGNRSTREIVVTRKLDCHWREDLRIACRHSASEDGRCSQAQEPTRPASPLARVASAPAPVASRRPRQADTQEYCPRTRPGRQPRK